MFTILTIYTFGGIITGILSSWVGAGGGAVIIPLMLFVCKYQGIDVGIAIHLSVSTSLSFIMFNALYNAYKHYKHGHIVEAILKNSMPTILAGAILGTMIGKMLKAQIIENLLIMLLTISVVTTFSRNCKPSKNLQPSLPSRLSCSLFGGVNGILSSIVGIGGSTVVTPYMKYHNYPMKNCAAMSAAFAFPIGLFATITMLISSYHVQNLPPFSIGYLYIPAFLSLLFGSAIGTQIGIRIVRVCPERISIWLFRIMLTSVIIDMLH